MKLLSSFPTNSWTLKESGFKALNYYYGLATLSELEFRDLQVEISDFFATDNIAAKGQNIQGFKAISFDLERLKVGISIKKGLTLV